MVSPSPAASPTPPSTVTAELSPSRTIALCAAGSSEQARLFSLAADGTTEDLGMDVGRTTATSDDGTWVATPEGPPSADAVAVTNLDSGTEYTIPVTEELDAYAMTFDSDAERLAILELGPPEGEGTRWALVIVNLEDGSTRRFEAVTSAEGDLLPGVPIGWSGDDLLVNVFVPYSEEGSAGLWSISLPGDAASMPLEELDRRQVLAGDQYLFTSDLSHEGSRLLYLNRDYGYTPDNYGPVGYDLAVNQLGLLDLSDDSSTLLVEETEGGALGGDAAWSPTGNRGLFAAGTYDGGTFGSLSLKTVDEAGAVSEVAPIPLPEDGYLVSLDWCAADTALAVMTDDLGEHQLQMVDLTSSEWSPVATDGYAAVLGCVRRGEGSAGNADVVSVRAVQTEGPAPGTGPTTWTFHVTVQHPDTGWEDYADGWDVTTPDGEVLRPDPGSAFTRTLLHPHVDEQPFTRSQSGIVVPEGVSEVLVRAHDIVDGYGGQEVVVDLTAPSGTNFEVER
jgi:hypothetical protein